MADDAGSFTSSPTPGTQLSTNAQSPLSGVTSGIHQGIQLAQMAESVQASRQQVDAQKQQLQQQSFEKYIDSLHGAINNKGPAQEAFLNNATRLAPILGMQPPGEGLTALIQSRDEDTQKYLATLSQKSKTGESWSPEETELAQRVNNGDIGTTQKAIHDSMDLFNKRLTAKTLADYKTGQLGIAQQNADTKAKAVENQGTLKLTTAQNNASKLALQNPLIVDTEKANAAGTRVQGLLQQANPKWADMTEAVAGINQIISGSTRASQTREQKLDLDFLGRVRDTIASKVQGNEVGGPSPEELNIWKQRVDRILKVTQQTHDDKLTNLVKTYKNLPDNFLETNRLIKSAPTDQSAQPAGQPTQAVLAPTQAQPSAAPAQQIPPNQIANMLKIRGPEITKSYLKDKGYSDQQISQSLGGQ